MSAMSVWHAYKTMTAATQDQLLWYVATYQAPLRDLQIHGLALFMILGVCLRMLPGLFNAPRTPDRRAWWGLGLLTAAVLGESVLFVVYRWTGHHAWATMLILPWLMLAGGVALVADELAVVGQLAALAALELDHQLAVLDVLLEHGLRPLGIGPGLVTERAQALDPVFQRWIV